MYLARASRRSAELGQRLNQAHHYLGDSGHTRHSGTEPAVSNERSAQQAATPWPMRRQEDEQQDDDSQ